MRVPRSSLGPWLGVARRALGRVDHWLADPTLEFWVCVVLLLAAPLIRLGFVQIIQWIAVGPVWR